jgi:hypothetical protein
MNDSRLFFRERVQSPLIYIRRDFMPTKTLPKRKSTAGNSRATENKTASLIVPSLTREQFYQEVNKRAYELFQQRGRIPGNTLSDWLEAENELAAKYSVAE